MKLGTNTDSDRLWVELDSGARQWFGAPIDQVPLGRTKTTVTLKLYNTGLVMAFPQSEASILFRDWDMPYCGIESDVVSTSMDILSRTLKEMVRT